MSVDKATFSFFAVIASQSSVIFGDPVYIIFWRITYYKMCCLCQSVYYIIFIVAYICAYIYYAVCSRQHTTVRPIRISLVYCNEMWIINVILLWWKFTVLFLASNCYSNFHPCFDTWLEDIWHLGIIGIQRFFTARRNASAICGRP